MRSLTLVVLLASSSLAASAQVFEAGMTGGYSLIGNSGIGSFNSASAGQNDVKLNDGFRLGFRMTFNNSNLFGHEVGYAYSRTALNDTQGQTESGTSIHQGFYDFLLYGTKEGSRVRPFAAGGAQFSNFVYPGYSVSSGGGQTKFGFNYGGGVKVKLTPMFLIRFDLRNYASPKPFDLPGASGWLNQREVSMGFSFTM